MKSKKDPNYFSLAGSHVFNPGINRFFIIKIGREFGGRDHTTVIHACKKLRRNSSNSELKTSWPLLKAS